MDKSVTIKYIEDIKSASEQGRLVVFVGAGVSNNSGVPVWSTLIKALKSDLPEFAKTVNDDLKLAQIYKTTYPTKFVDKVKDVLRHGMMMSNPVHDAILDLHPAHIITTNYDDLLEQACSKRYEQFSVIRADEDLPSVNSNKLLIKMHGDFEKGNIVLAEQDYYDYYRNFPLIRAYVMSLFASKTIMFVGFSFDDINLKFILRELKVILQKKMQPVYLLTGQDMGHEQLKYLEDKGINPLCILPQMLDVAEASFPKKLGTVPDVLTNFHGRTLYRQLRWIKYFSKEKDSLQNVIDSISKYDDEFRVYGEYLRYIAPEYLQPLWHQRYNELDIDTEWFQRLCKKGKSFSEKKKLYVKYKDYIAKAFDIALRNHIYYIGRDYSCPLFIGDRYKKTVRKVERDGVDDFYRMKLLRVHERITELSKLSIMLTRKDLELPYLYYKIGKSDEAFKRYFELAEIFWEKKRFILYMICRINMRALANPLSYNNKVSADIKAKASEIKKMELADILNDLPMDKGIRKIFIDVISYKMLLVKVDETAKICHDIEKQSESAKRGGFSWNNYAQEMLYYFYSLVDFCNANYIILDSFEYARKTFCNISKGLMRSLMIQGEEHKIFHLPSFRVEMVILFLFHLRKSELLDVLRIGESRHIQIDDDAKKYIADVITNLLKYTNSDFRRQNKYYNEGLISDVVFNLCSLLCYLPDDCMSESGLYLLIAKYMRICDERDYVQILQSLVVKRKPSADEAEQILDIYLQPLYKSECSPWLLSYLAKTLAEEGKPLDKDKVLSAYKNLDLVSLSALRPAITEDFKKDFDGYINRNINNLYDILTVGKITDYHIFDENFFKRLLDEFMEGSYGEDEVAICYLLSLLFKDERYVQYKPMIDPKISNKPVLAFFLNPAANVEAMDPNWILWLDDEQLREMIKAEGVMRNIDDFCKQASEEIGKQIKNRIWKVLTKK